MRKTFLLFLVTVTFLMLGGGALFAQQIEKGPYLIYEGNAAQMAVHWQLSATTACTLAWGTTTAYGSGSVQTNEYGNDHQHKHVITGLASGTRYYYRVSFGSNQYTGSFRSAPAGSAQNLKFLAYGDTRSYPADHNDVAGQMITTFTNDPAYQTFTIHVGDWINTENESDWANQFFPRTQPNIISMQAQLPIQGCRGNHEGNGSVYGKYYPYPYVNGFYWSFDYGPVHVAVVDQYVSYSAGSAQMTWLENDLASTSKKWIILVFHEPGWSAGGHANDTQTQSVIQPLCKQYGVDIVFAGHNHYYARCEVEGIQHVTAGGGGAPLYAPDTGAQYLAASSQTHHFCEIDIQGNTLDFIARDKTGAVLDSFQLVDSSGPAAPTAAFSAGSTALVVGQSTTFTDQSGNAPTSWSWNFGDGTVSTQQNPSHAYAAAGTYTVALTATNAAGSDTETKVNYITVTAPQAPLADFSASAVNVYTGQAVTFTDASQYGPTSWSWDFGDGGTSAQRNPSHTYTAAGTYTVALTATNAVGSDTETKADYVVVTVAPLNYCASAGNSTQYEWIAGVKVGTLNNSSNAAGYTDFTNLTADLNTGGTVNVTLTPGFASSSYTEAWKIWIDWNKDGDFADAGEEVFSGSGKSAVSGSFTVPAGASEGNTRMRVSMKYETAAASCGGFNYGEVEDYTVSVGGSGVQPPVADFSANVVTINAGDGVSFTDQSTNAPTSWSWDFGDGGTSTQQNPTHVYASAGTYTVTMTAANAGGNDTRTRAGYITVNAATQAPVANFTAGAVNVAAGQAVNFTDTSSNGPATWSWDFGDGGTSTQQNPSHTYTVAGTYTVSLQVSNSAGSDSEIKTDYITVTAIPVDYCAASGNSQQYEYISAVQVGNLNNSSAASGYSDFTAQSVNTTGGASLNVTLTPGFAGSSYTEYWRVWVDWNGDGDFADTGEQVFSGSGKANVTGSFSVPSSASGTYRMRVIMKYNSYAPSCGTFDYGEVEDYSIIVQ